MKTFNTFINESDRYMRSGSGRVIDLDKVQIPSSLRKMSDNEVQRFTRMPHGSYDKHHFAAELRRRKMTGVREEDETGYDPQKHEWGTDDSTKFAKKMTPGELDEGAQTADWKKVQQMDKGAPGSKERLAYYKAELAHRKKYGQDTKELTRKIEKMNRSMTEGFLDRFKKKKEAPKKSKADKDLEFQKRSGDRLMKIAKIAVDNQTNPLDAKQTRVSNRAKLAVKRVGANKRANLPEAKGVDIHLSGADRAMEKAVKTARSHGGEVTDVTDKGVIVTVPANKVDRFHSAVRGTGLSITIFEKKMKGEDPCWDDHEMVGHKMKNGKKVPNCVPKEAVEEEKGYKQLNADERKKAAEKRKKHVARFKKMYKPGYKFTGPAKGMDEGAGAGLPTTDHGEERDAEEIRKDRKKKQNRLYTR